MERKGIFSAGNWIIDHVKLIDTFPREGNLVNILAQMAGNGGCPYNILVDLARMQAGLPLWGAGCIGRDADGDFILNDLQRYGIDASFMHIQDGAATSYTDVMTVRDSGARTFFHCRGANAVFSPDHLKGFERIPARIFHLGYLLLLDTFDNPDPDFGVVAARILADFQRAGFKTSVDVVSEQSDRFRQIVTPCLKYTDYLIVNEIEAGQTTDIPIRNSSGTLVADQLKLAASLLIEKGVGQLVVIHFPEGGYALSTNGTDCFVPSFHLSPGEIKGTVGAGDAFCAGVLYGIHEGWPLSDMLKLGNATARFNLLHPTSSEGIPNLDVIRDFVTKGELNHSIL